MTPPPTITLDHLRAALALPDFDFAAVLSLMSPMPRPTPTRPEPPREAGVLALIAPDSADGALHIVLTLRNASLRGHSGQVSFPGGKRDPEDDSFVATALRETREELGISVAVDIIGQLAQVYIPPSHFNVYPTVGYVPVMPLFVPNPDEVAEVFTVALATLLDDATKREETRDFGGVALRVPYYELCGHKVWGATGLMLCEIEQRLRRVLGSD